MIIVGISRVPDLDEWRVWWEENGRDDEAKAHYTDDLEDATSTLVDIVDRGRSQGLDIQTSEAQMTRIPLARYHWLWAQNEIKGLHR